MVCADSLPVRKSSRLIILDPDDRVLLMKIKLDKPADPSAPILKSYWVTLGGGVNVGETLEQAAQRELHEETGISNVSIGPMVWHGRWQQGVSRINDESFFLVQLRENLEKIDISGFEKQEKLVFKKMQWWTIKELKESDQIFIPISLADLVEEIISTRDVVFPREIDLSTPKTQA